MSTGDHQGIVADENGRNIAVAYDKNDAAVIAAAPEMYEALWSVDDALRQVLDHDYIDTVTIKDALRVINDAICSANGF